MKSFLRLVGTFACWTGVFIVSPIVFWSDSLGFLDKVGFMFTSWRFYAAILFFIISSNIFEVVGGIKDP